MIQPSKKTRKVFENPIPTRQLVGGMPKVMWQYITAKEERVPKVPPGPFNTDAGVYNTPPAAGLRITWMGHSSMLIEIDGNRFLTDPVTGRASFASFAGPKRFFPYPLPIEQLPQLEGIIISHDHYDHLDYHVMQQLKTGTVPFYTSLGVGGILESWGINKSRITEMDWGNTVAAGRGCTITATPARHFSGRGIISRNQTLWSSFVIKSSRHNVFFGADSGWFPGFKDIGDEFGPFDITMLEVGAYGDGWPDIHMGPGNATNAHLALGGKLMMPIHWGTFNLALHSWREPVQRTIAYAKEKNIALFIPEPGKPTEVNGPVRSDWWR